MAAKLSENRVVFKLGIGERIGPGIELGPLFFHIIHGHDLVLGLKIGQQVQCSGPGTDDMINNLRYLNLSAGGIGDHVIGSNCTRQTGKTQQQASQGRI